VGQREEPGEITELERSQITVKPASEEQAGGVRLAELVWAATSQQRCNFASFGISAA